MSDAPPAPGAIERLRLYYAKNEQRIAVLSFIGGFLFDIIISSLQLIGPDAHLGVEFPALCGGRYRGLDRSFREISHLEKSLGHSVQARIERADI